MGLLKAHANKALTAGFFGDRDLDFATRGLLGRSVRGGTEVVEVLATIGRVHQHGDWATQWSATATRVEASGVDSREPGRLVSASSHFLRASTYWAAAVDGLSTSRDSAELTATFASHRRCWNAFIDCSDGVHVAVEVPYEGTTLPGYLLRPDDSGTPRPTLVITNGSDGSLADLWTTAIAGALLRGWNAFVYDGPGQQSMLFERGTTSDTSIDCAPPSWIPVWSTCPPPGPAR